MYSIEFPTSSCSHNEELLKKSGQWISAFNDTEPEPEPETTGDNNSTKGFSVTPPSDSFYCLYNKKFTSIGIKVVMETEKLFGHNISILA
jgi:hypothetical protein